MTSDKELQFHSLRIKTSNEIKGNFVRLPSYVVQTLENTGIAIQEFGISVLKGGKTLLHVGWDGHESQSYLNGQSTIEINPILAQSMPLPVGGTIDLTISRYGSTRIAEEVYVEPESSDDWEIIETHGQFFQDEILHQTRVVAIDETLFCYVNNVTCRFKIQKIVPSSLRSARINTGSLIVISPLIAPSRIPKTLPHSNSESLPVEPPRELPNSLPVTIKRSMYEYVSGNDNHMCIHVNIKEMTSQLALISILHNSMDSKHYGKHDKQDKNIKTTKKIVVAVEGSDGIPKGHVAMTPIVWDALWYPQQNGCKIIVESFKAGEGSFQSKHISVLLRPVTQNEEQTTKQKTIRASHEDKPIPSAIKDVIEKLTGGPLTDKMVLLNERLFLELIDEQTGRHIPYITSAGTAKLKWNYSASSEAKISIPSAVPHSDIDFTQDNDFLPSEVTQQMIDYLLAPVVPSNGIALTSTTGMGKTTILKELAKELMSNYQRYVNYVDCNTLSDVTNVGKMKQHIQEICSLCYWHHPSVILFDNAEILFPSSKSDDPQQQATLQASGSTASKLALHLTNLVESIGRKNSQAVRVVFTAPDRTQLNNLLFDKHFISETFKRKAPDVDERGKLIEFFISKLNASLQLSDDITYRDIALETDCYSPLDLQILVDKLFHHSITKTDSIDSELILDKETYVKTLKDFSPTSLRGVKLTRSTGIVWKNIGALHGPKRILLETLEWPTKYAPIFKNCPLQLRSGVLLYGYPGCGKTMLASAVAQQCGLNFITVNGPEILNKYIGASEQNVRELFERAQSVKPCILFFDEFDSIAPKRGHDSTGVTDRIVNQLLTQMDGVEGLDGVYVLAATSRPDLIDSALLRPGRIDKSVLCNIPDQADRLDILHTLTSTGQMELDPATDLTLIAQQTAGYSGADLQGLCYNAYLKAVHRELLSQTEKPRHEDLNGQQAEYSVINARTPATTPSLPSKKSQHAPQTRRDPSTSQIKISSHDLLQAAHETKPSISASEYHKLHSIYTKFQDDRQAEMSTNDNATEVGTRTSLM